MQNSIDKLKQNSNPLLQMKQLVSLQASSVRFFDQFQIQSQQQESQLQNYSHQQESHVFQFQSQNLHNNLMQIRQNFPKLINQFQSAKQEILSLSFKTINKIMSQVYIKNSQILTLKVDLQKSKEIQLSMKKQVIQLKDMINQFVSSYSKQISSKEKEIQSLKELMKTNFTSPRNVCRQCQNKIRKTPQDLLNHQDDHNFTHNNPYQNIDIQNVSSGKHTLSQIDPKEFFRTTDQILIVSSNNSNRLSLEIIQEESQANTTTDYQQSIRQSLKEEKTLFSQISKRSSNLDISSRLLLPPSSRQETSSRLVKEQREKSSQRRPSSSERKTKKFIESFRRNTHEHQNQQCKQKKTSEKQNQTCKKLFVQQNQKKQKYFLKESNLDNMMFLTSSQRIQEKKDYLKNSYFLQSSSAIKPLSLQKSESEKQSPFQVNQQNQKFQFIESRKKNKSISNVYAHKNLMLNEDIQNYREPISKSSSSSDILHFGDTDKINLPLKQQTPKNMMFLKKKEDKNERMMTEPSPRLIKSQLDKQNLCVSHSKISETSKKIFARKRTMTNSSSKQSHKSNQKIQPLSNNSNILNISYNTIMNSSNLSNNVNQSHSSHSNSRCEYSSAGKPSSNSSCKNSQKSKSKQKIKVTSKSKIIQQFNQFSNPYSASNNPGNLFKKSNKIKGSVHLGGKFHFKKTLVDIKDAMKKIELSAGQKQVKFEGSIKNGVRQGFGRIIYENGLIFQGQFNNDKRNGEGKLVLNGIEIFTGDFKEDQLSGQGYIKSLRFMIKNCPTILGQASYYGKIQNNKLQGMGTLFLNNKEKIVTKFSKNIPYGQLTYYSSQDIQFGLWGQQ